MLTIVNNNTRQTKGSFDLRKYVLHGMRIGQIGGNIDLVTIAIFFLEASRCKGNFVALCGKGPSHMLPDIRTRSKNENNWRCVSHA